MTLLGFDALNRPIRLSEEDTQTHRYVIGSSGSGKSKFLEWMIRGALRERQGFCLLDPHGTLYEDVVKYCSHEVFRREIILLDLSRPDWVVGFNPFQKELGSQVDTSVQVDRLMTAVMHAWGTPNTDETPTLARVLSLVFTLMIELDFTLPQAQHLIDYEQKELRTQWIEQLSKTPLIQQEWRNLQQLKRAVWNAAVLFE